MGFKELHDINCLIGRLGDMKKRDCHLDLIIPGFYPLMIFSTSVALKRSHKLSSSLSQVTMVNVTLWQTTLTSSPRSSDCSSPLLTISLFISFTGGLLPNWNLSTVKIAWDCVEEGGAGCEREDELSCADGPAWAWVSVEEEGAGDKVSCADGPAWAWVYVEEKEQFVRGEIEMMG